VATTPVPDFTPEVGDVIAYKGGLFVVNRIQPQAEKGTGEMTRLSIDCMGLEELVKRRDSLNELLAMVNPAKE
jgi:hypothetical protein